MDDWDGLENRCGGNSTVGSNPTPSAFPTVATVRIHHSVIVSARPASPMSRRQWQPSRRVLSTFRRGAAVESHSSDPAALSSGPTL